MATPDNATASAAALKVLVKGMFLSGLCRLRRQVPKATQGRRKYQTEGSCVNDRRTAEVAKGSADYLVAGVAQAVSRQASIWGSERSATSAEAWARLRYCDAPDQSSGIAFTRHDMK